ncbi:MAG: polyamine aminopropyltransferase [Deltaproteobacteria bacterium]|nr:polyamine aminopropyltransferase [Deltaproteobacteria bacterium]
MDLWFHDDIEISHGLRLSIKVREVLCHYRTTFQELAIFETERLGKMLVLDNITMLTEFDEFAYHEMIAHVPLLVHPEPKKILIIGGGDGGTAREVLKHPSVEKIDLCEIDEEVIRACRKHIPSLACSFDDERVRVFCADGARFVTQHPNTYDVIIVDSTDPVGPGKVLFQRKFYEDMKKALRDDGIAVTQCESLYLHRKVIKEVASFARDIYPTVGYYNTLVPTYPSGIIGFFFCSLKYDPLNDLSSARARALPGLQYYSPETHRAAFTLPRFGADLVG